MMSDHFFPEVYEYELTAIRYDREKNADVSRNLQNKETPQSKI